MDYLAMNEAALRAESEALQAQYQAFCSKGLKLDMSRGKPSPEQLDLSMDMLHMDVYKDDTGVDARNYGQLEGIPEARRFFAELMGVRPEEVVVGGNSSLAMMYMHFDMACRTGFTDSPTPWGQVAGRKFLCPSPGYDRHFRVAEEMGFELVNVPMTPEGPDMNVVEELVKNPAVKGIWCVPLYSNPDGYSYSGEVVKRMAAMQTAAPDFRIFWDNAYGVHHWTDEPDQILNIMDECRAAGHENRPLVFMSTSKVTFAGAGVGALAASESNIGVYLKYLFPMSICFDKINQLRHVRYIQQEGGMAAHMKKHAALVWPKFQTVLAVLQKNLADCGAIARWTQPKGGYFLSFYTLPGCATRVVALCKQAGVVLTGAGAAFPYGKDPQDTNIRIAPTFPCEEELATAVELLCLATRMATVEKLLEDKE